LSLTDLPAIILVVLWAATVVACFAAGYHGAIRGVMHLPRSSRPVTGLAARITGVVFLWLAIGIAIVGVSGTVDTR
jgi:hypothetical protein